MSVFKVKLNYPGKQGQLDINPVTGLQFTTSIQRTVYIAGPTRRYRELRDGTTFTDCNYWKRFAYPQVPMDQAIVEVITDDGAIYTDGSDANTYPLVFGGNTAYNVLTTDAFTDNYIDIIGSYGGYASYVEITNNGTSSNQNIKVQLNGASNAILSLPYGDTKIFNAGDLQVSKLAFQGGSSNTTIQVILSVAVVCNS